MLPAQSLEEIRNVKMGDVTDSENFIGAVIDEKAFDTITGYIEYARTSPDMDIIIGGGYDDSTGYFMEPTVVVSKDPKSRLMVEDIFGPVLTVYIYAEGEYDRTLELCDKTSPYALRGSIFALDRGAVVKAMNTLRHAAGDFYIDDKSTGAVVSQQPFGGTQASGTNDKAGSWLNLER
jgi:1-pyrroline-5-carboxylate dehydrogenase